MSTLGFALLGLLAREPATGYELSQELRRPVGYFWRARHSQVYPALAALEADGLVEHTVHAGPGPRPTKRYAVTPAGLEAVRGWLRSTTPEVDDREILLRVYLVWLLPPKDARAMLLAVRRHHEATLEHYRGQSQPGAVEAARLEPREPAFGRLATLAWGIEFEERRIAWVAGLVADLDRASPPASRDDESDGGTAASENVDAAS
jgi:DNA-binding PadR family transcriptional regulator